MATDAPLYGVDGLTLGERIRRARRRLGKKQTEVAFSAELNVYALTRWETDRVVPTLRAFASLAEMLQAPMEQLFWGPLPADDRARQAEAGGEGAGG